MLPGLDRYGWTGIAWRYAATLVSLALLGWTILKLIDPDCTAQDPRTGHCIAVDGS